MALTYTQKLASLWVPADFDTGPLKREATEEEVALLYKKIICKKYLPFIRLQLSLPNRHFVSCKRLGGAVCCIADISGGVGNVVAYFPKSKELYHFYLKDDKIVKPVRYTAKWLIDQHEEHLMHRRKRK